MGTLKFAAHENRSARTLAIRGATASAPKPTPRPTIAPSEPVDDRRATAEPSGSASSRGNGAGPATKAGGTLVRTLPRGERLAISGGENDPVTVVQSGWIALFRPLPGNRSICVGILGPGDLLLHDRAGTVHVTAEALLDSTLLQDEMSRIVTALGNSPALVQAALLSLRRQNTDLQEVVSRLLSRDITLRLAGTLLALTDRFGKPALDEGTVIGIPIAHKMLARMIGSNRVTVTRVMTEMRDAGLVSAPGRNQVVVHVDKLRAFVANATSKAIVD